MSTEVCPVCDEKADIMADVNNTYTIEVYNDGVVAHTTGATKDTTWYFHFDGE